MLDLVPGGSSWDEVVQLGKARRVAAARAIINTGIGWHEARIPTIATSVPRAAFAWVTQKMKGEVAPRVSPAAGHHQPHQHARGGRAAAGRRRGRHGVAWRARCWPTPTSWARPRRAEPTRSTPASPATRPAWTTCSQNKSASCLVNPRACHETELVLPSRRPRPSASPWSAPARPGLAAATLLAERGHAVTLFDAASEHRRPVQHGQAGARQGRVPRDAALLPPPGRDHRRGAAPGQRVAASELEGFDEVIIATGVTPRDPKIPGQDHPKVLSYIEVLREHKPVGERVAIIGAGGIGFDVAEYLVHERHLDHARPARLAGRVGRDRPGAGRWRPGHRQARGVRPGAPGHAAAAQGRQARRRPGQDHRLDPPHGAQAQERGNDRRRELRAHRRRGPARRPTARSARNRPGFPATPWCSAPASCRCAPWPTNWLSWARPRM